MSGPTTLDDFADLVPPGVARPREWLEDLVGSLTEAKTADTQIGAVQSDPAELAEALQALAEWSLGFPEPDPRRDLLRRHLLHWLLRPALRIASAAGAHVPDEAAPPIWGPYQGAIGRVVRAYGPSIGRVDVAIGGQRTHLGTAWVFGTAGADWLLLTARHVLVDAGRLGWPGPAALCLDFGCLDGPSATVVSAARPTLHPDLDLAVLRVARADAPGLAPLPLDTGAPTPLPDHPALVVGHPGFREGAQEIFATATIGFDGVTGVKRASPGRLRDATGPIPPVHGEPRWRTVFAHDGTTLGGNSGSPVVSLVNERVVGLHVGGRPTAAGPSWFVDNYALPVWIVPATAILGALGFGAEAHTG